MAKTIKIIELLNKIANGEKVPEKIKWNSEGYKFNEERKDYVDEDICSLLYRMTSGHIGLDILDNYVEIIEEQQDIDNWEEIADAFGRYGESLAEKIAEIGRQLNRNIKDKE